MEVSLELPGGETIENPKAEDVDRALALPRDDDWYLDFWQGEDENLIVSADDGKIQVDCFEGEKFVRAQSHIDEAKLRDMVSDFVAGGTQWRQMVLWAEPPKVSTKPDFKSVPAIAGMAFAAAMLAAITFGGGKWAIAVFALAFPGIIAVAAFTKMQDVKRASSWSKATAKIVQSQLVTKTINNQEVQVAGVEYEFAIGMDFNKMRGSRVTLAEVEGPHGAQEILSRYRVGTSVPVYYNPANPKESVLERDMPTKVFAAIWALVAVLTLGVLGGAYWFLLR